MSTDSGVSPGTDGRIGRPRRTLTSHGNACRLSPPRSGPPRSDRSRSGQGAWKTFKSMPILVKISADLADLHRGPGHLRQARHLGVRRLAAAAGPEPADQPTSTRPPASSAMANPSRSRRASTGSAPDAIARDTFARIAHGGWVSMIVALVAARLRCGRRRLPRRPGGLRPWQDRDRDHVADRRDPRLPGPDPVACAGLDLRGQDR